MINASNAFKEKLEAGEPVRMVVNITFPDGTKKTINKDIMNGGNGFSDCADSSSFPVGATICKTLTLSINNDQEQWKSYNFYGAKIHAYLKLQTSYAAPESVSTLLDESYNPILDSVGDPIIATQAATKDIIETIDKGVYTVTTPEQYSDNVNNLSLKAHDMLKVSLYFDQSKTKLADYQTYSVAVDVASLTQEQIVDILSDDGKFKGLYYEKDESGNQTLFISFNAMKGGVISLGGVNNGNGQLKIYDADGKLISRLGYTGYVVLNKNTGNPMVSLNTAGLRLYTDYTDADNYNALMLGKYGLYAQKVQNNVPELWMEGDTSKKWEGYIVRYLNNKVRINTNSLFTDGCELGANFSTDGSATIGKSLSVGGNATVDGTLMFYDLENQAKTSGKVKRQPVASVSADDSQVAYLFSGTGSKHGETIVHRRLGIRAKWGGARFSTDYLYTDGQVSDIRLKENIKNSETDALETVNQMKVRQFDWKEQMGGWHQNIGFVADELEEIDPNLALGGGYDENGEMDVKQINSPYLLNYAIKAIQELSAKVDEQEKRIKELERRLQ